MHAARLDRSERLRRVHALLSDRLEHSTQEIVLEARVCAVNSIVAELRANGFAIEVPARTRFPGRPYLAVPHDTLGTLPPTGEGGRARRNKGGGGSMIRAKGRKGGPLRDPRRGRVIFLVFFRILCSLL